MKQNDTLNNIRQLVLEQQLGKASKQLENYLLTHPRQADMDQLMELHDDYRLMADYWQRGFDDPRRNDIYQGLLRRLYRLTANIITTWQMQESAFMKALHLRPRKIRKDWSVSVLRDDMEAFVGEVTMLQLEPDNIRQQKAQEIYARHGELMRDLFDYILTSRQWRESLADAFLDMILSPTLATTDQQLMVSAITMSNMQMFCPNKFKVLAETYRQSTDEEVRQRALVGWALTADHNCASIFPEIEATVTSLLSDEDTLQQLAELQMQLVYCLDADSDTDTIRKEILPDIMSGSNLKIAHGKLVEMDEDTLDDILHPEASELAMERMEQSMQRMVDMQKQGADIYFGGFSQMKRFPFFNEISNWFVPFSGQHHGISEIWNNTRGKKILKAITRMGAFCDSDKYSFVLAFNQVLDRLPKNMLKMIEEGEATAMPMGGEVDNEERRQPAFIRRMYLQDLYRFFRLYPSRNEFNNPFDTAADNSRLLFFANPLMKQGNIQQQTAAVTRFLLKRQRYADALNVLLNLPEEQRGLQSYLMMGTALQRLPENTRLSAAECYRKALELQPDNERALAGMARTLFDSQDYGEALDAYQQLMEKKPEHKTYQLNAAVCMLNMGKADEALKMLYKLNYMYADDMTVSRVLAWALTIDGKYEQADKIYCKLLEQDNPASDDMLNYGFCLWFAHHTVTAISMFRQFLHSQTADTYDIEYEFMQHEHQLIAAQGITDVEIKLMLDAITL